MRKVAWFSNAPAPYKTAFMRELGQRCELTAFFEVRAEKDRNLQWYDYSNENFRAVYLKEENKITQLRRAAEENDILIDSDYSKPWAVMAGHWFHRKGKPVILHADGGLAVPRGPLDHAISFLMKRHDGFLSSGTETDNYFSYYGINQEAIHHFRFACASGDELEKAALLSRQKQSLREKLQFSDRFVILSVGQPIPRKGFDILVRAVSLLEDHPLLVIIGGEPEEEVRSLAEKGGADVRFLPFADKQTLMEYYAAADVFALATRYDIWGLVINEAMAYGLPVVSTTNCVAAVSFTKTFANGEVVPAEDPQALAGALRKRMLDEELRKRESEASFRGISEYTYAGMADDFMWAIEEICTSY